jgi:cbb3-type cytochrome oxidase maturation protein
VNILLFLIFVGLVLVGLGLVLFVYSVKNEDFDHSPQLSLKPLEEDRD